MGATKTIPTSRRWLLLLACVVLAAGCGVQSTRPDSAFLATARVESILFLPNEDVRCAQSCPEGSICVTNTCGCTLTQFRILKTLWGATPDQCLQIREDLDEWCEMLDPVSPGFEVLLQRREDNSYHVGGFLGEDSAVEFHTDDFPELFGVSTRVFADGDGWVPLDKVIPPQE
ncbi:MAG: hypothetical protein R3F12_01770 [Lysobacteraceae bacterium]